MQTATSGGRRASRAALEARSFAFEKDRIVTRKELGQAARDAQKALNLRPSSRFVLQELTACWGEQQLKGRILVWPSNERLVEKTGLSERSVRGALRSLIQDKLITPKDSANGKRFAIKDKTGQVMDAFGFDLTPLYVRQDEFAAAIDAQEREKEDRKRAFDDLTIMRRATAEIIRALSERDISAAGPLQGAFDDLAYKTPRRGSKQPIDQILGQWSALKELAENKYLESGNGGKNCRHIETNNESPDSCNKAFEEGCRANPSDPVPTLALVAEATPMLKDFDITIRTWQDAYAAARDFRSSIGAHKSAWSEAVEALGLETASAAVLYVAQLIDNDAMSGANRIKNPGGYFRALIRMMAERRFNLAAEMERLCRQRE